MPARPLLFARRRISRRALDRKVPRLERMSPFLNADPSAAARLSLFAIFHRQVEFLRFRAARAFQSGCFHSVFLTVLLVCASLAAAFHRARRLPRRIDSWPLRAQSFPSWLRRVAGVPRLALVSAIVEFCLHLFWQSERLFHDRPG